MKKPALSLFFAFSAATVPANAKLTVHEWGTFTVLQAPDGTNIQWYLASNDIAPLPPFVGHAMQGFQLAGKTGTGQRKVNGQWVASLPYAVRMETPVIYFYPDAPMDVKVGVNFPEGQITEFFPKAQTTATGASWQGSLLPATPESLKTVLDASGPLGRHYAAARAVPEAWLFRNAAPPAPAVVAVPDPPFPPLLPPPVAAVPPPAQTDHFIFYRGAGNNVPVSIRVATKDDRTFTLTNASSEWVPVLFLLRVEDGKAAWTRVDNLPPPPLAMFDEVAPVLKPFPPVTLPEASEPLAASSARLKTEMLGALEKEGLTQSEAAAMVATWDSLWFEEPGTRVLALLPQKWVDAALPLQITPKPDTLKRVFVARLELLSRAQETTLASLLAWPRRNPAFDDGSAPAAHLAAARAQLQKLALGRFAPGAFERALTLKKREMQARFDELTRPEPAKGIAPTLKPEELKAVREGMKKVVEAAAVPPAQ